MAGVHPRYRGHCVPSQHSMVKLRSMLHSGEYEAISTASSFTFDADRNIIISDIDFVKL